RSLATISHGSNKVLENANASDIFSKVAHGNAALWQVVKLVEEYSMLKKIKKQTSVGLLAKSLLKKHYHGALPKDGKEEVGQEWWKKKNRSGMTKKSLSRSAQYLLAFADYLASIYVIHQNGANKKKCLCANFVRSFCDLASRFALKDGQYKSESWVGKVEAVSSAVPLVYDSGKGGYKFFVEVLNDIRRHEKIRESFFRVTTRDREEAKKKNIEPMDVAVCPVCLESKFAKDEPKLNIIYKQSSCCGYILCSTCWVKCQQCPQCRDCNKKNLLEIKNPEVYLEKDDV
ncbi:hypothetical protein KAT92_04525, partial [Candidatus Babeliales bacterium]|nr:hypothetical protein [Candidatus Babeliales bacterium]